VKFTFPSGFVNLEESTAVHDAGFDAYRTAKAFAVTAKILENSLSLSGCRTESLKEFTITILKAQKVIH
jgi:hypothetical protein